MLRQTFLRSCSYYDMLKFIMCVDKILKFVTLLLHAKWVRVRFFFVMIKSVRDSVIHSLLVNYHLPYYSLKFVVNLSGRSRISQTGGANFQGGGANLLFGQFFTKNCIKMKEFGPGGGGVRPWRHPLDPPMNLFVQCIKYYIAY